MVFNVILLNDILRIFLIFFRLPKSKFHSVNARVFTKAKLILIIIMIVIISHYFLLLELFFVFSFWFSDRLTISYSISSGPGGQHVNKGTFQIWTINRATSWNIVCFARFSPLTGYSIVSTKAEVRFNVHTANWIPEDVRQKIIEKVCSYVKKNYV